MKAAKTKTKRSVARALLGVSLASAAASLGYAFWWRRNPSACPYGLRFFVELPHPFITRARLREAPSTSWTSSGRCSTTSYAERGSAASPT